MKYCISVEDIYGSPLEKLAAPEGWEFTGEFRPPLRGEMFRDCLSHVRSIECGGNYMPWQPRLIVKRAPTVEGIYGAKLSELTAPFGYEFTGEFRGLKPGDCWLTLAGELGRHAVHETEPRHRLILRELEPVEEVYGAPLEKLTPPSGYRLTGEYRRPTAQDVCLHPNGLQTVQYSWIASTPTRGQLIPRLILEKLPPTPTIKDVYGTDKPGIPKGWKMKEFRRIEDGEQVDWLADFGQGVVCRGIQGDHFSHKDREAEKDKWRIVLEREFKWTIGPEFIYGTNIPPIPAWYEVVAFRPPLPGEYYLRLGGGVDIGNFEILHPRLILSPLGPR